MVNEEEYKRLIDGIGLFIKQAEQKLPLIQPTINWIVDNKIHNPRSIEKTLDTLLGFVSIGLGGEEYHKLNDFYSTFSPKNAKEYKKLYKKISGNEY